jgi:hypothetical protein
MKLPRGVGSGKREENEKLGVGEEIYLGCFI